MEDFSIHGLKNRFKELFVFRNEQQIINRFHVLLLILIITIFYLVLSFSLITKTNEIIKPSLSTYKELLSNYSNSLECPCSNISIEYQSFLTITPRIHEICSSEFMLDDWINYIFNTIIF